MHFHNDHTCHLYATYIPRKYTPSRFIHLRRSAYSRTPYRYVVAKEKKKKEETHENYFYNGTQR